MSHFFTTSVAVTINPEIGVTTSITRLEVHDRSLATTFLSNLDLTSRYTTLSDNAEWVLTTLLSEIFRHELFRTGNGCLSGKVRLTLECRVTESKNQIRCIGWVTEGPGASGWVNSLLRNTGIFTQDPPIPIASTVISYYMNKNYWYARRYRTDDDLYLFRISGLCPDIILKNLIAALGDNKTTLLTDIGTDALYERFTLLNYELAWVKKNYINTTVKAMVEKYGIAIVASTPPIIVVDTYMALAIIAVIGLIIGPIIYLFTSMLSGVS